MGLFVPLLDTLRALVRLVQGDVHVLLTVTSRLSRAHTFEAEAVAKGWRVEELVQSDGSRSFYHTRLLRLSDAEVVDLPA